MKCETKQKRVYLPVDVAVVNAEALLAAEELVSGLDGAVALEVQAQVTESVDQNQEKDALLGGDLQLLAQNLVHQGYWHGRL